jgi:tight adherence protein B
MNTSLLIPMAVAAGVLMMGFAFASDSNAAMTQRVKGVAREKESAIKRKADPDAERKKKMLGGIKDLEMREKKMRKARLSISARIEQAGLTLPEQTFWVISAGLFVLAFLIAFFIAGQPVLYAAGAGAVFGFGFPRWVLGFLVGRCQRH